jgi:SAM-dependent methyltransferase
VVKSTLLSGKRIGDRKVSDWFSDDRQKTGDKINMIDFYNDFYTRAERSKAHGTLCERVYGKNLCQHGMADMSQIEKLLALLNLNEHSRLLDLGCGNGYITEYIQDRTDSYVTGVDLSPAAIESAISRTKTKSEKLKFQTGDMMNLQYRPKSFDSIILIDTHYFIDDFEALIDRLIELIVPNGQICIFSDEGRGIDGCDDSNLQASESLIGQLLETKGLSYTSLNLSKENREHWKLKEKVLKELKADFDAEGNMCLYNNRLGECISSNRELDCRFLFSISKSL